MEELYKVLGGPGAFAMVSLLLLYVLRRQEKVLASIQEVTERLVKVEAEISLLLRDYFNNRNHTSEGGDD